MDEQQLSDLISAINHAPSAQEYLSDPLVELYDEDEPIDLDEL